MATLASTCLMCGEDLSQEETPEPVEAPVGRKRVLPGLIRAAALIGLALVILAAAALALMAALRGGEPTDAESHPATTATPSPRPSPTRVSSPTVAPSPTPAAPPTAIPPRSHQVQQGETLGEIAREYDVEVTEILQFNADLDPELLRVGQVLLIPPDLESLGVTRYGEADDPLATRADFVVHVVRSGDALLSIAGKYGVTVQEIRRANDLQPYDDTLRVNQSLIIPLAEPTPTATSTPDVAATPTPRPPYAAPPLLSPIDRTTIGGIGAPVVLQWASVGILEEREWYLVRLTVAGSSVFSETHTTRTTSWRVPVELLSSGGSGETEFRWWVQVVNLGAGGAGSDAFEEAGATSEVRGFLWNGPPETPTPQPGAGS